MFCVSRSVHNLLFYSIFKNVIPLTENTVAKPICVWSVPASLAFLTAQCAFPNMSFIFQNLFNVSTPLLMSFH